MKGVVEQDWRQDDEEYEEVEQKFGVLKRRFG